MAANVAVNSGGKALLRFGLGSHKVCCLNGHLGRAYRLQLEGARSTTAQSELTLSISAPYFLGNFVGNSGFTTLSADSCAMGTFTQQHDLRFARLTLSLSGKSTVAYSILNLNKIGVYLESCNLAAQIYAHNAFIEIQSSTSAGICETAFRNMSAGGGRVGNSG